MDLPQVDDHASSDAAWVEPNTLHTPYPAVRSCTSTVNVPADNRSILNLPCLSVMANAVALRAPPPLTCTWPKALTRTVRAAPTRRLDDARKLRGEDAHVEDLVLAFLDLQPRAPEVALHPHVDDVGLRRVAHHHGEVTDGDHAEIEQTGFVRRHAEAPLAAAGDHQLRRRDDR